MSLRQQVLGLIEVSEKVIASKGGADQHVDATTIDTARVILEQAKKQVRDDKVLAAVKLDAATWTGILTAMKIIAFAPTSRGRCSTIAASAHRNVVMSLLPTYRHL